MVLYSEIVVAISHYLDVAYLLAPDYLRKHL